MMKTCCECGEIAELRPYGRKGAMICFECGMKARYTTEREYLRQMGACGDVAIIGEEAGPYPLDGRKAQ